MNVRCDVVNPSVCEGIANHELGWSEILGRPYRLCDLCYPILKKKLDHRREERRFKEDE